jgi:UPF0755 protein
MKRFLGFLFIVPMLLATLFVASFSLDNVNSARLSSYIYIPSGATYADVLNLLNEKKMLKSSTTFEWIAKVKDYPAKVKAGRYFFSKTMNNREIVNLLKSGLQSPVKLNFYNVQTKEDFAGVIGRTLEVDSIDVIGDLNDSVFCGYYSCTTDNVLTNFIYSDLEIKWDTEKTQLYALLAKRYSKFWNAERLEKSAIVGLDPKEVYILASIVEKECIKTEELTKIAGVYVKRLQIGMPLQADPTLKFAKGDFNAKRVTSEHKDFVSAYNTYQNKGLPPGPICMPRMNSIDAVLNFEPHSYLYFCANPDMSGYSVFSETLDQHNKVAVAYRKKLNELNIH